MPLWRPPSTMQERAARAVRSMDSGTLNGRVVAASPVNKLFESDADTEEIDSSTGPNILPYTDYFKMTTGGSASLQLTYAPYSSDGVNDKIALHVYWNNVFQKEPSYTLSGNLLTVTDSLSLIRTGDIITVKYWYDANYSYPEPVTASPIWHPQGDPTHWIIEAYEGIQFFSSKEEVLSSFPSVDFPVATVVNGDIFIENVILDPAVGQADYLAIPAWSVPVSSSDINLRMVYDSLEVTQMDFELHHRPKGVGVRLNPSFFPLLLFDGPYWGDGGFFGSIENNVAQYVTLYNQLDNRILQGYQRSSGNTVYNPDIGDFRFSAYGFARTEAWEPVPNGGNPLAGLASWGNTPANDYPTGPPTAPIVLPAVPARSGWGEENLIDDGVDYLADNYSNSSSTLDLNYTKTWDVSPSSGTPYIHINANNTGVPDFFIAAPAPAYGFDVNMAHSIGAPNEDAIDSRTYFDPKVKYVIRNVRAEIEPIGLDG